MQISAIFSQTCIRREQTRRAAGSLPLLFKDTRNWPLRHTLDRRYKEISVKDGDNIMLRWAITFLVIALIAAVLGFGGIAAVSMDIAKVIFLVFIVLFIIAAAMHVLRGKTPPI
jgi:uncharacterized membrane protein YtjA (UPF0391 family)